MAELINKAIPMVMADMENLMYEAEQRGINFYLIRELKIHP